MPHSKKLHPLPIDSTHLQFPTVVSDILPISTVRIPVQLTVPEVLGLAGLPAKPWWQWA